ncbi:extracellular solute-binding protein [Corynebacterium sp. AOP40-9SA-29]|uniref:extracellular solute-binding protein n=1 Tax=Corynebacterium sp. AOP40-9SA-29 TaxID=3457677 RepID=UPI004033E71B
MAFKPSLGAVLVGVGLVAVAGVFTLPGGTVDDPGVVDVSSGDERLNLVAYAVPKPGFEAVIRGFRDTPEGADTGFAESYGASGDQSRKVARHLPTDIVNFSVEPDVTRLVDAGQVADDWREDVPGDESGKSVPFGSVVSFVTREGNPLGLENWDDLLEPGVEVISPNPASSGSAKWNLLAPYASWFFQALDNGADTDAAHSEALDKLTQLVGEHFTVRPKSGREATSAFESGQGDVLLSYENEAIELDRTGGRIDYTVPDDTFRIENPVALVDNEDGDRDKATAFRDYLFTPEAEKLWAAEGFRPGPDLFDDTTDVIDSLPAEQRDAFRELGTVHTVDELAAAFRELAPDLDPEGTAADWDLVDQVLFKRAKPGSGEDSGAITTIYQAV